MNVDLGRYREGDGRMGKDGGLWNGWLRGGRVWWLSVLAGGAMVTAKMMNYTLGSKGEYGDCSWSRCLSCSKPHCPWDLSFRDRSMSAVAEVSSGVSHEDVAGQKATLRALCLGLLAA